MNIKNHWRWLVALGAVFVPGIALGAVTIPFTFQSGTLIRAADMNANFTALKNAVDQLQPIAPGLSVSSVVDHRTGPPGGSVTSVTEASLTPIPMGATVRRPTTLNAVLRSGIPANSPVTGILQ